MMEVFAGYGAHVDHEMGRVLDAVAKLPDADNTLVIYIVGDNGVVGRRRHRGLDQRERLLQRHPRRPGRTTSKVIDELGGPKHFNHFPSAGRWAMDTPFQWTKQVASHFGGTRNPMIVSWPARITDKGGLRTQFHHVIDVVPTILEAGRRAARRTSSTACRRSRSRASAWPTPSTTPRRAEPAQDAVLRDGRQPRHLPRRLDGLVAVLRAVAAGSRRASTSDKAKWELYNIDEDFSQANDLAAAESRQAAGDAGPVVGGSGAQRRPAARLARAGADVGAS